MPSSVIKLDETQRVDIYLVCCFLYSLGCAFSVGLVAFSVSKWYLLDPFTALVDGYNAKWLWIVIVTASGVSIGVNAFGVYLCFMLIYPHKRHQYVVSMAFCTVLTVSVALAALVCVIVCYLHGTHLGDEFRGSLISSLKRYRDNEKVKRLIDQLQLQFQCCGSNKYTDWFQIAWIAEEFVDSAEPDVRDRILSGSGYQTDSTPFSCCNPNSRRPCINLEVHGNSKHYNYDYQKQLTLHKVGCLQSLQQHISVLLFQIGIAFLALFILEIILFVLARFVKTSVDPAAVPTAAAKGVAFGLGGSSGKAASTSASPTSGGVTSSAASTPRLSRSISRPSSHLSIGRRHSSASSSPPHNVTKHNVPKNNVTKHNVNQSANWSADTDDDDVSDMLDADFLGNDDDPEFDIISEMRRQAGYDGSAHLKPPNWHRPAAATSVDQRQQPRRLSSTYFRPTDADHFIPATSHGNGRPRLELEPYLGSGPLPLPPTKRCERVSNNGVQHIRTFVPPMPAPLPIGRTQRQQQQQQRSSREVSGPPNRSTRRQS